LWRPPTQLFLAMACTVKSYENFPALALAMDVKKVSYFPFIALAPHTTNLYNISVPVS